MRHLIVALDSSPFAERALPTALDLARHHGARLELLVVHQPSMPAVGGQGAMIYDQRYDLEIRARLEQYLSETATRLRAEHPALTIDATLLDGMPVRRIAEHVRTTGADLLVITSHGRGGPARWLLGSVADGLVRSLLSPVLVIRSEADAPPAVPFRKVVVAVDGTPESEASVPIAVRYFGRPETRFTLLTVVPPLHPVLRMLASADEFERDTQEQQAASRAYLRDAAARGAHLADFATALIVDRHPAHGISAYATEHGADLLVMSTHGRGPVGRAFLGSVADKVVRTTAIPILLCHVERVGEDPLAP
jgi:nucleotide-binding universal stress UspA family protein